MVRKGRLDGPGVARLIDVLMEPTPATYVGAALKLYREREWDFEPAWAQVMRSLPRHLPDIDAWRESFHAAKPAWKRAYLNGARQPHDAAEDDHDGRDGDEGAARQVESPPLALR